MLGIIPKALKAFEEELVVSGMQEKIIKMLKHVDAFIFLPEDLATLESLITFASWAISRLLKKSIGLLNVNNFYDGFIAFINHTIKNHFISVSTKQLFFCAPTANKLLDF